MVTLYKNQWVTVSQPFFGYSFRVKAHENGATVKVTGALQESAVQCWHLIRSNKSYPKRATRAAEDAMFSMLARAAFDPSSTEFFQLTTNPAEVTSQRLLKFALLETVETDPALVWYVIFEDPQVRLERSAAGSLRVTSIQTGFQQTPSQDEASQFAAVRASLELGNKEAVARSHKLWSRTFCRAILSGQSSPIYQICFTQDPQVVAVTIAALPRF